MRSPILFFLMLFMLAGCTSAYPQMNIVSLDPNNVSCNAIIEISNVTDARNWTFAYNNVTSGIEYRLYMINPETYIDSAIAGTNVTFESSSITNGTYWIVEYQPEIYWSYLNPTNTSCYGRFEISNASMGQNWSIKLNNVTSGYTYKLFSNDNIMYATAIAGDNVSLNTTGLQNGWYWIGYINDSSSFVTPSVVVGVSFVIGSAIVATFINRFRRRE